MKRHGSNSNAPGMRPDPPANPPAPRPGIVELQLRTATARGKAKQQVLLSFETADTLAAELQQIQNDLSRANNLIRVYQSREAHAAAQLAAMRNALEALIAAYRAETYSATRVGDDDVVSSAIAAITEPRDPAISACTPQETQPRAPDPRP